MAKLPDVFIAHCQSCDWEGELVTANLPQDEIVKCPQCGQFVSKDINPKEVYLEKCKKALKEEYAEEKIRVKVVSASVNGTSWFDNLLGQEIDIIGIDHDAIPKRYITKDADYIPFACAQLV